MSAPAAHVEHMLSWRRLSDEALVAEQHGATWRIHVSKHSGMGYVVATLPRSNGRSIDDVVRTERLEDCGGHIGVLVLRLKVWCDTYADLRGLELLTACQLHELAKKTRDGRRRRKA